MAPPKLRIAVMQENVQSSDIIGADLFGNISQHYVQMASTIGLGDFTNAAPEIEFFFPATSLEPAFMTPGIYFKPTHTYDDVPRDLDVLLIGGSIPTFRPSDADRFMKEAFPRTKVVFTTCIGSLWLASTGIMNGKKATTNREYLPIARSLYPDIEWVDHRWVIDGKLWSSGGAGAGVEMIWKYLKENFDKDMVDLLVSRSLQFDPNDRGQFYNEPPQYSKQLLETDWKTVFTFKAAE